MCVAGLLIVAVFTGSAVGGEDPNDLDAAALRQLGVERGAESLGAFLRAVTPAGQRGRQFAAIIGRLGAESYRTREEATAAVLASKLWYPEMVKAAAESGDAEVRARCEQILEKMPNQSAMAWQDAMRAALNCIARDGVAGLAAALFDVLESSDDAQITSAAIPALRATVRQDDLPLLRKMAAGERPFARVAAVRAMAALPGKEAAEQLAPLLADAKAAVRAEAAIACLNRGHRPAVAVLVDLLKSDEPEVRARSVAALRAATGRRFGFAPYEGSDDRAEPLRRWLAWLQRDANTAELKLPIPDALAVVRPGLVLWNRLGSPHEIAASEAGPGGMWNKQGRFVRGVFGGAIEFELSHKTAVTFPSEVLSSREGCIEIWAQLVGFDQNTPGGHSPALVLAAEGGYIIMLNGNDGASHGGLCVRGGSCGSIGTGVFGAWTLEKVLGKGREADWHHYAVTWNVKGIPGVGDGRQTLAAFLDGKLNSSTCAAAAADTGPLKGGKIVVFDQHHLSRGRVRLDNFKAWRCAKTDFSDRLEGDGLETLNNTALRSTAPPVGGNAAGSGAPTGEREGGERPNEGSPAERL